MKGALVSADWEAEIVVVGGGPAGSMAARCLALLGHDVRLIEQHGFPRPHVGESLSPGILPLFDVLGIREQVENASFLRPQKAIVHWRNETNDLSWQPGEPGFQVDRGEFDLLLLRLAADAGVTVLQPARALAPIRNGSSGWIIPFQKGARSGEGRARFLIVASGKQPYLPAKRRRTAPAILALYGYWRDTGLVGAATRVEAGVRHWYWGAPLPGGLVNAAVFVDPRQCKIPKSSNRGAFYRQLLSESILLRECLNGTLAYPVSACSASSFHDPDPMEELFAKVGEAAFAVDPLSSQGVHLAMLSAFQASIACHTVLTNPERAPAAIEFYRTRQSETVERHRCWAGAYYAEQQSFCANEFWAKRAHLSAPSLSPADAPANAVRPDEECRIAVSADVVIVETPVLSGSTIGLSTAISHPGLERPVAFLDNVAVAPLVAAIVPGQTIAHTREKWSAGMSTSTVPRILDWMWSRRIIVPIHA